jgi:hypothetical protein
LSSSVHKLGSALRAMPVLSFAARNGEYCRQIEVAGDVFNAPSEAALINAGWAEL